MESSVLVVRNLIESFRLSCQTEGKSPKTTEWYIAFLNRFCILLEQRNLPNDFSQIDKNHIGEFIHYLQTKAKTPHQQ